MSNKTLDDLWKEFLPYKVKGKKTEKELIRIYERYIQPTLGKKRLANIDFKMCHALHQSMIDTPIQANRMLDFLKRMFRFSSALGWTIPGHNPASAVTSFPERKRQRHMKSSEAPRIAQALRDRGKSAPEATLFVWLLIFTGARSSEIKRARWCDIQDGHIVLASHKSEITKGGDKKIALPPIALTLLEELSGNRPDSILDDGSPSTTRIISLSAPHYIWPHLRKEAGCEDLRLHDLRHTFGTYALEKGYTLDQIGEALSHADPKTTKIYAELTDKTKTRMATDVSLAVLQDMEVIDRIGRPSRRGYGFHRVFGRNRSPVQSSPDTDHPALQ